MKKEKKTIEITLDSIAFEGSAVGRIDGKVYFIKNAVPGDKVVSVITKSKKKFAEGNLLEIISPSKFRVEPKCEYFGECGGCNWQNLEYHKQLEWKKQNVIDAFERIGNFYNLQILDTIGSHQEYNYRNKMEFSFGANRWLRNNEISNNENIINKEFALGLHISGRFDKILDIDKCAIQNEYANQVLKYIKTESLKNQISPYNLKNHSGFLRSLIIRYSLFQDSFMVILITNQINNQNEDLFLKELSYNIKYNFDKISNLIYAINTSKNPVTIDSYSVVFGDGYFYEKILDLKYKISPFSFFQTNSYQINTFINRILEFADITTKDIVWDLFCGAGSITLPAAKKCKFIYGVELSNSAIIDANFNKKLNNISNVEFLNIDLNNKNNLNQLDSLLYPDLVILDPPRAGISSNLIDYINKLKVQKLVYVSCNPSTQARDCKLLSENYEIIKIQPVDMFPHTYHIENIALLMLKA